ncbi:hypothetical protein [Sinomonas atrocyanea]|uniref:hypothetical protein n=1 Tax=Sinomonas atrocyanea TaxID=37927 RepID=UPI00211D2FA1|nr:hypothetical protein [Sinomonas atrocyanea]
MPAHFAAVLHAVTLTDDDAAAAARALEGQGPPSGRSSARQEGTGTAATPCSPRR